MTELQPRRARRAGPGKTGPERAGLGRTGPGRAARTAGEVDVRVMSLRLIVVVRVFPLIVSADADRPPDRPTLLHVH